jgi:hypothetical protein
MLNTFYNYFTSSYQPKLAHFPSRKSGVYEVKSKDNFMMAILAILAICISNLIYFFGPLIILNLEMWVLKKSNWGIFQHNLQFFTNFAERLKSSGTLPIWLIYGAMESS